MTENIQYSVRDPQGNIYGPATAALLRQWVAQGRIVAGMSIRTEGGTQWIEASAHPVVADLFQRHSAGFPQPTPATPQLYNSETEISYGVAPRSNGMAIASLVLGIIALIAAVPTFIFFCCCGLSLPSGIIGVVLGFVAYSRREDNLDGNAGKKIAIAGIVLSILAIVIAVGIPLVLLILGIISGSFKVGP